MMTREQKLHMLVIISVAAVFAVAASPIATAYAQESTDGTGEYGDSEEKRYGDKEGKSCAGKDKHGMNA